MEVLHRKECFSQTKVYTVVYWFAIQFLFLFGVRACVVLFFCARTSLLHRASTETTKNLNLVRWEKRQRVIAGQCMCRGGGGEVSLQTFQPFRQQLAIARSDSG